MSSREHTTAAADRAALEAYLAAHQAGNEYLLDGIRDIFTKNGRPVKGALALPVGTATNAVAMLGNSAGRLVGFALKETTGVNPAELDLLDGVNADGDILVPITLTAGQSTRDWYGPAGISFGRGLFAQLITGSVTGTVWIGRIDI